MASKHPFPRSRMFGSQHPRIIRDDEAKNPPAIHSRSHFERVRDELRKLGVSRLALFFSRESIYLPKLIHPDEKLTGVVYGHDRFGTVMMVATDRRVLHLSKRLFYANEDEISYDSVAGVSFNSSGFASSVTLHTRFANYRVKTYNRHSAEVFIRYIEERCLERTPEQEFEQPTRNV